MIYKSEEKNNTVKSGYYGLAYNYVSIFIILPLYDFMLTLSLPVKS